MEVTDLIFKQHDTRPANAVVLKAACHDIMIVAHIVDILDIDKLHSKWIVDIWSIYIPVHKGSIN